MSWAYDSVTCIFLLEQCHVWPTLCECAWPGVDSDFLDKREETQRIIDIVQESTVRPFYMIRTQSSKLKAKCTCCRRQGSHVRDWQGGQGDCFEPKLIFMPIHWFQTGIMEYETYETEAPYDDMDDQVTKGKVWRFVIFNFGGKYVASTLSHSKGQTWEDSKLWREQSWEGKLGEKPNFILFSWFFLCQRRKQRLMFGLNTILLLALLLLQSASLTLSFISRSGNLNVKLSFSLSQKNTQRTSKRDSGILQLASMLNPSRVSQVANIVFSSPIYLVLQPKEWSRWWGKGDGCGIIKSGRRMWPKAEPLKTMALLTAWNAARSAKRDIRRRKPGRNSLITRNANASPIPMTLIRSIRVWLTAMEPILLVFVGKILNRAINNCISGYTVAHYGVKSSMRR